MMRSFLFEIMTIPVSILIVFVLPVTSKSKKGIIFPAVEAAHNGLTGETPPSVELTARLFKASLA